jgi:CheY-like chemotaxis protein
VSIPDPAPRYLLIIDDEDDIREVASLSLEMTEGWRVATAPSCASGIELARTSHPDAILLDVMMPEMDGPTGLREIRRDPVTKDTPVIFLTAKVQEGDLRRFLDLGVQGVIAKPFDPMDLGRQVRELLGWTATATP